MDCNCCSICLEIISDFSTKTPCGHVFHSACLFKNFETRFECPLCRQALIKEEEEEEEDEDEEGDEDGEDDEDDWTTVDDYDEGFSFKDKNISISQLAAKLKSLNYTMEDILLNMFVVSDHPDDVSNPRWKLAVSEEGDVTYSTDDIPAEQDSFPSVGRRCPMVRECVAMRLEKDLQMILKGDLAVDYTVPTKSYADALKTGL